MWLMTLLQSSIWDVKFSQKEENDRQFRHVELSSIAASVRFSNSVLEYLNTWATGWRIVWNLDGGPCKRWRRRYLFHSSKKKFMGTNLINVKTFGFFVSLFIIKIVFEYYYTFSNFNAYKILELILFYQIQYISVQWFYLVLLFYCLAAPYPPPPVYFMFILECNSCHVF